MGQKTPPIVQLVEVDTVVKKPVFVIDREIVDPVMNFLALFEQNGSVEKGELNSHTLDSISAFRTHIKEAIKSFKDAKVQEEAS